MLPASLDRVTAATSTEASDPMTPLPTRTWWHRNLPSEERRRVLADLAITKQEHWGYRFTVMLTLSVVVAVMGLSADSAAVVIGAMLLAPLMGPVLATAGCLSMALFKKAMWALFKVFMATVWCIGLSYVLAKLFVPNGPLSNEVLARTKPDIRDLMVALGAGAAGSYATVRKDASSALPGVAVAVALVPPLAAVGIALEDGQRVLAKGALLLYSTNLAAIIFASVVVFVVTGFVPPRRLATTSTRLAAAAILVIGIVVAITVPLYHQSQGAIENSLNQAEANEIVSDWLGDTAEDFSVNIGQLNRVDDRLITVAVRSFEAPIDDGSLRAELTARFGGDVVTSVQWDRIERAETTTTTTPPTTVVSDSEKLQTEVERIVDEWLAEADSRLAYDRDRVLIANGLVRITAAGVGDAPSRQVLQERLDAALPNRLEVQLFWTSRQAVVGDATVPPTPLEEQQRQMSLAATAWADNQQTLLDLFSFDGNTVTLEVAGLIEPDITALVPELDSIAENAIDVQVFFTQKRLVTTTTTSQDQGQTTTSN